MKRIHLVVDNADKTGAVGEAEAAGEAAVPFETDHFAARLAVCAEIVAPA